MRRRAAAISNHAVAAEAAQELLASAGSAVGAVLGGFFAAAGAQAGVLLGPISVLVAGVGIGARAFDGRLRQPGLGAKRPRGFLPEESIPDAARVAVPTSVAAAAVAYAYDGSRSLATLTRAGISRAERSGAPARAAMLKQIRSQGAAAFHDTSFVRALLRVAGPSQGGLLSPADFGAGSDVDHEAAQRAVAGGKLAVVPWASELEHCELEQQGTGYAVCAVDVRGVFAALCFRRVIDGFLIEELELEAPLAAVPVLRSVTRVAPGARLPTPAPMAVRYDASGVPVEVVAAPARVELTDADLERPPLCLRRSTATQEVEVVAG